MRLHSQYVMFPYFLQGERARQLWVTLACPSSFIWLLSLSVLCLVVSANNLTPSNIKYHNG